MNSKTKLCITAALVAFLVACGGGGGGSAGSPTAVLSLDGIYRGSPVVVSADGFTYDYEFESTGGWRTFGTTGRIYTTTVNPNDTIDGTATIYGLGGTISTAALTGTITPGGAMSLNFQDGANTVNVATQRILTASTSLSGRAFCSYEFDDVTVHSCGEFDILNRLVFNTPTHGTQNIVTVDLGAELTPDVYEVTVDWEVCGNLSGLASFAVSEDGVYDELVVTVVGGQCNFVWWLLRTTR